ncbi:MAG: succinyldiaminopimelate transaminase [Myxococcota bacterium]|jgi:succinyldiaminopimelate transaminase
MPRLNPIFSSLQAYPPVALQARKAEIEASGRRLFDFSIGDPVEPTPEFIRQAMLAAVAPRCGYPTVRGARPVRVAMAGYLHRRFGVTANPDTQILPTAGSKEAVFHIPLLVIDPNADDRLVVFPDPGYPAYMRGALFAGGEPHAVHLSGDHVFRPWTLPDDILRRTRLLWVNSPHNPSGAVTPLDDLQRIADVCRKHDILCVSDESYADIYHEHPPHSMLECGDENVIVLHSLSKRSGMTGYRSGFLAGDPTVMGQLCELRSNPGLVPQDFINAAAAVAWSDDAHVEERRQFCRAKKALFLSFFDEAGIEVIGREATLYLWLKAPGGDAVAWAEALLEAGLVVSPGAMFGVSGGGAGYVRLALVPSIEECREALSLWRTLL